MMSQPPLKNPPAKARFDGIEIVYDTFGEATSAPILLIMGLGAQMTAWDEDFCAQLAHKGYWVIRFDNRDVGLSTKLNQFQTPPMATLLQAALAGNPIDPPYTLADMAEDAFSLLDTLSISSAHLLGASMGGMIAQLMAIHHPDRVRTLTSIMSSTSAPGLPMPDPEAIAILVERAPLDREGFIQKSILNSRTLHGSQLPFDEDRARQRAKQAFDRGIHPEGFKRQFAAVLAATNRKEDLQSLKIPALVIHGSADPLVPVEGGIDTAEAIPRAQLRIIEGMGHSLPPAVWPQLLEDIEHLAARWEGS